MNNEAMKEVLNELFSHLERLETQSEAILQFLKEKKRVTDKQLAPYLEQAGNAANVKWRAARIRIDHLLSPEHPEEEIKLGKKPELHEERARAGASDEDSVAALVGDKRTESSDKEGKRAKSADEDGKSTGSGDPQQIESSDKKAERATSDNQTKSASTEAGKTRHIDGNADKPEVKSELNQESKAQPAQEKHDQKSGSTHHPTEVTEPLARKEGAEPAAQLKPDKTASGKEAA